MYMFFLFNLFTITDFYMFWLFIELCTLLFIGICYTLFVNRFSQLMFFFLIQTIASFNMLVFYVLSFPTLFLGSILLKVAIFPFIHWYINVAYRFPNSMLLFISTVHKIPPMLLFYKFANFISTLLIISIILTLLFRAIIIFRMVDLRALIIVSRVCSSS